jgi:hypothetical protein
MAERTFKLTFLGDATRALASMRQVETAAGSLDSRMGRLNDRFGRQIRIATGVGAAALTGFAANGVRAASNLTEAQNKANVVFGEHVRLVEQFASTSANAFGISERAGLEYAATLGQILQASGLTREESAAMSVDLVKLAADMASFNNISIEEAFEKLRAGLVGETEPLRTVGVLLSAAAVEAKAAEMGLTGLNDELTEAEKVQARYALILEQTSAAQGDFTRTADSAANASRRLSARTEEVSAKFGSAFLPVVEAVSKVLLSVPDEVLLVGTGLLALAVAIGGVLIVLPLLAGGFAIATTAAAAVAAAIAAISIPVLVVIAVIAAVIAAGVLLWKNWDTIKEKAGQLAGFLVDKLGGVKDFVVGIFNDIAGAVGGVIDRIGDFIEMLQNIPSAGDVAGAVGSAIPGSGSGFADALGSGIRRLPGFDSGGVVPGPRGRARLVMAHGGETILPTHRTGGAGMAGDIHLHFNAPLGATSAEMQRIVRRALTDAGIRGIGV